MDYVRKAYLGCRGLYQVRSTMRVGTCRIGA
jgi:hypothetical protein